MSIIGDLTGANQYAAGAQQAANTQSEYAGMGIDEINSQLQNIMGLMQPYLDSGTNALGAQGNLIGLGGADAQAQALAELQASPQFTEQLRLGEQSIMQNASATGGLRGGDTQGALAQYSPQLLNQLIESQYSKLGGLSNQGLSAANTGAGAYSSAGGNIANLLGQQGSAIAGGQLAAGSTTRNTFNDLLSLGGTGAQVYGAI